MRISAVILSYNSAKYIAKCIHSLAAALKALPPEPGEDEADASGEPIDEIFVTENGSKDGSVELLKELQATYPGLLHVDYLDHNTGTTYSRNLAMRKAKGDYILVMDSDVEVPLGTIEVLRARLARDRRTGLVAPRLMYPSGRLQMSTDVFPTIPRKLTRYVALKSMERRNDAAGPPTEPVEVDYAISAFWLFRRDVMQHVGLFDEKIFYSPEDVDYCLRVWEAGYRIIYDPTVHAIHDAQEISRGFPLRKITFSHAKGLAYLFWKHGYALGHSSLYRRIGR